MITLIPVMEKYIEELKRKKVRWLGGLVINII